MRKFIYQYKWFILIMGIVMTIGVITSHFSLGNKKIEVYPAPYLDELLGVPPDKHASYIVKSPIFHTPKCAELETWAQQNLPKNNDALIYSFSKYDKAITPDNAFLKHDYVAQGGDFEICRMNAKEQSCFLCADNQ